jgi:hypothetical protein
MFLGAKRNDEVRHSLQIRQKKNRENIQGLESRLTVQHASNDNRVGLDQI